MKTILLVIAVIAAGGSAYWGMTTKGEVVKVLDEKNQATATLNSCVKQLDQVANEFQDAQKLRESAFNEKAQVSSDLETAKNDNTKLTSDLAALTAEKEAQDKTIAANTVSSDGRNADEMIAESGDLENKIKESKARAEELTTLVDAAVKKVAPMEADLAKLEKRLAEYSQSVSHNGAEFAVTAIDPKWGFVIFNAGDASGLDAASPMLVTRNGKRLGVLKITQIEKNQTIADIVPSSVKPGNVLQVGDKVILLNPQG